MTTHENFALVFAMAALAVALAILVNSAVLWLALRLFKQKENSYKKALKAAALAGVVMFFIGQAIIGAALSYGKAIATAAALFLAIPAVTFAVNLYVIKKMYKMERKRMLVLTAAWTIAGWVASNAVVSAVLLLLLGNAIGNQAPVVVEAAG